MPTKTASHDVTAAIKRSHDDLIAVLDAHGVEAVTSQSYCSDWSVAQVLSHLGSGAEIGKERLRTALDGEDMPADFAQSVWDRWNAYPPERQAAEFREADAAFIAALEAVDDATLEGTEVSFGPMQVTLSFMSSLRLNEHILHSWDVRVSYDPDAELPASAVVMTVDAFGQFAPRLASADVAKELSGTDLAVLATDLGRAWSLRIADAVSFEPDDGSPAPSGNGRTGTLRLTGAALQRLLAGRLDAQHTPVTVEAEGRPTLDDLRRLFPGL